MCFFQFEIIKNFISYLALSYLFEYLCYESTAILNILILPVGGTSIYVRIWRIKTVPTLTQTSDSDV